MRPPFKLVNLHPPDNLVETLEYLLDEARAGRLIGLAYGGILKRRAFFVDASGEASRNPMFGVGIAHMLAAELLERAREYDKAA